MSGFEKRGRPRKDIPFDEEVVKEYIQRLFTIEQELKTLREGKKDLKEEFKDKVDMKVVAQIIRLVKAELKINCSEDTKEQLSEMVKDKINMVVD